MRELTLFSFNYSSQVNQKVFVDVFSYKNLYKVATAKSEEFAEISGKLRYSSDKPSDYPAVGDFVMTDREDDENGNAIIHYILRRKSIFTRRAAGTSNEIQVVAANIDIIFICMSLNNDFNLRRLERYLSIAWNSGATPVVVLTKSDLCDTIDAILSVSYTHLRAHETRH